MSGALKLLIPLNEKNAKNTGFAQVRYTAGTRSHREKLIGYLHGTFSPATGIPLLKPRNVAHCLGPSLGVQSDRKGRRRVHMSSSDESSTVAVRQFISECLREHHAMQCYVRQQELFFLPIALSDDTVVVMPIDTDHWEVARRRTLKLKSIEEPRLHKMQVQAEDLERVRLAIKHSYPMEITYFDESGKEIEAEVNSAFREEGDFLVGDIVRIRIQWISQVSLSLPDYKNEAERRKLPALVDDLIESPDHSFRQTQSCPN